MRARLEDYDVRRWAAHFLERLEESVAHSRALAVRILSKDDRESIVAAYGRAGRRLLLLDYDGTLAPFTADPGTARPSPRALSLLKGLCADPRNRVVLVTGRKRDSLSEWFEGLPMNLVAENGVWTKEVGGAEWTATIPIDGRWKDRVRPILQRFVNRVPGSAIEEKDTSLVWHYRRVNLGTGALAAQELTDTLTNLTANLDLVVLTGNRVVEVRTSLMSKGTYFQTYLAKEAWDFILAIGDDWTDESLFAALPPESASIRIGLTASTARFNVESIEDALGLLERLAAAGHGPA